jgi:hypothetical protein
MPVLRGLSAIALAMIGAGCGYTTGFAPQADVRTVAVQIVGNQTFRQRLERDLTRAIARQLSEYSAYRHSDATNADAVLEVEFVAIRNTTLVIGSPEPVREGSLDAVARIRLVARRSGRVLVETRLRDIAEYRSLIGEDETTARRELVSDLGRRIVLALEGGF